MIDMPTPADIAELKGLSRKDYFEERGYNWEEVEKILRLNRTYKAIVNSGEDEHHLIPTSKGGSNIGLNRKKLRRGDHVHFHDVFGVKLPHEQIEHIVDFNRKVFLHDITQRIYDIIDNAESRHKIYKPQVFFK